MSIPVHGVGLVAGVTQRLCVLDFGRLMTSGPTAERGGRFGLGLQANANVPGTVAAYAVAAAMAPTHETRHVHAP